MKIWIAALIGCLSLQLHSQEWQKVDKVDTFSGQSYVQYTLTGKFLTPPQHPSIDAPVISMSCVPGEHRYAGKWYYRGANMNIHINTGAIINSSGSGSGVLVWYRRDDGKAESAVWSKSTDQTALFPGGIELNQVLFGHDLVHKEHSSAPVKKLVLMADEYLGARFVMQFDLPDSEDIYASCGLTIHQE